MIKYEEYHFDECKRKREVNTLKTAWSVLCTEKEKEVYFTGEYF
jgi:hypothetical protein